MVKLIVYVHVKKDLSNDFFSKVFDFIIEYLNVLGKYKKNVLNIFHNQACFVISEIATLSHLKTK